MEVTEGSAVPARVIQPFVSDMDFTLYVGDVREVLAQLPDGSVDCCVTSPPYWGLRDYGHDGQIGLEATPAEYVAAMVAVFNEVHRVLTPAGTCWLNLGDSYAGGGCGARDPERWPKQSRNDHMPTHAKTNAGVPHKSLVGVPWRVAIALIDNGWILRRDVIWEKANGMPESAKDRPTSMHEYLFMLTKEPTYYWDHAAAQEPAAWDRWGAQTNVKGSGWITEAPDDLAERDTRNIRSVWKGNTASYSEAHFAVMPTWLAERCVSLSTRPGEVVLDPFGGAATTARAARNLRRRSVLIEISQDHAELCARRLSQLSLLAEGAA